MDRQETIVRRLIQWACEKAQGKPVLEVWIAAAKCAQLDEGNLRFYWDKHAAGTPCHGAKLHIRQVAFLQKCPLCGHIFPAKHQDAPCPACGARHTGTLMGEECVIIERLEAYTGESKG